FNAKRGITPKLAPHLSYLLKKTGNAVIHSSLNMNMQSVTEKLMKDYTRSLKLKNIHNAAVVIIDNASHRVITYVGSSDFDDTENSGQVDGVSAVRQPGSTLKPLLYGMCIDEGIITPKSVIADVNIN